MNIRFSKSSIHTSIFNFCSSMTFGYFSTMLTINEWVDFISLFMLPKRQTSQILTQQLQRCKKTHTQLQAQPPLRRQYWESSEKAALEFPHLDRTTTEHKQTQTQVSGLHFKPILWIQLGHRCTWNLSFVPLISMRELRHSPTTMPICLIRTTLLSRWLCMPPSIHWSRSENTTERGELKEATFIIHIRGSNKSQCRTECMIQEMWSNNHFY